MKFRKPPAYDGQPRKPPAYDGQPPMVRIHLGYCSRAWTPDGECSCWHEAESFKLDGWCRLLRPDAVEATRP